MSITKEKKATMIRIEKTPNIKFIAIGQTIPLQVPLVIA